MAIWTLFTVFVVGGVVLVGTADAVDRSNFKRCDESSFCKRNRDLEVSFGRSKSGGIYEFFALLLSLSLSLMHVNRKTSRRGLWI